MISARIKIDEYSNRVLNVIKAKYDLKDKSEAINKFIELYGDNEVEKEVKDEYVKKVLLIAERDSKKYGNKKMTLEELDKLCE
jgi:hypothetical protein